MSIPQISDKTANMILKDFDTTDKKSFHIANQKLYTPFKFSNTFENKFEGWKNTAVKTLEIVTFILTVGGLGLWAISKGLEFKRQNDARALLQNSKELGTLSKNARESNYSFSSKVALEEAYQKRLKAISIIQSQSTGETPLDEKAYFAASVAHLFIEDVSNNQTQKEKANEILAETVFIANQTQLTAAVASSHKTLLESIESDIKIVNSHLEGVSNTENSLSKIQKEVADILEDLDECVGSGRSELQEKKDLLIAFKELTLKQLKSFKTFFKTFLETFKNHQSSLESKLDKIQQTNNPNGYFQTDKNFISNLITKTNRTVCDLESAIERLHQNVNNTTHLIQTIDANENLEID